LTDTRRLLTAFGHELLLISRVTDSVPQDVRGRHGIEALLAAIRACRICRDMPHGRPLPHEPRPVLRLLPGGAPLLICSQAPGTRAHASGMPFTDPSGQRLRFWLGLSEAQFYDQRLVGIVPMGFCFPGQTANGADLPPRRECAATWHDRLFDALAPPALLCAVGLHAIRYHLNRLGHGDLAREIWATAWSAGARRWPWPG
jgi:uracil-DNA glycosylase